jgi:hypothetical protein
VSYFLVFKNYAKSIFTNYISHLEKSLKMREIIKIMETFAIKAFYVPLFIIENAQFLKTLSLLYFLVLA